jgi:hypothetical protein
LHKGSSRVDAQAAYVLGLLALEITIDIDSYPPVREFPLEQCPESLHLRRTERCSVNREMLGLIGPPIPGEVHEAVGSLVAVSDSHDLAYSTVKPPMCLAIGILGSLGRESDLDRLALNQAFKRFSRVGRYRLRWDRRPHLTYAAALSRTPSGTGSGGLALCRYSTVVNSRSVSPMFSMLCSRYSPGP